MSDYDNDLDRRASRAACAISATEADEWRRTHDYRPADGAESEAGMATTELRRIAQLVVRERHDPLTGDKVARLTDLEQRLREMATSLTPEEFDRLDERAAEEDGERFDEAFSGGA